jgi:hypothetical protein
MTDELRTSDQVIRLLRKHQTIQHSTKQHSTKQHNRAHNRTAQHSTAQHDIGTAASPLDSQVFRVEVTRAPVDGRGVAALGGLALSAAKGRITLRRQVLVLALTSAVEGEG